MEITRENLLEVIRAGMKRHSLTMSQLEKEAGISKDSVRDFIRGKTYIMRANKLQKVMRVLDPNSNIFE